MRDLAMILVCVVFGSSAQLCLKAGMRQVGNIGGRAILAQLPRILLNPFILLGGVCAAVSATLWLVVLSKKDLSYAYPIVAVGYAYIVVMSWLLFGEQMSAGRLAGVALVCAGVTLVARS